MRRLYILSALMVTSAAACGGGGGGSPAPGPAPVPTAVATAPSQTLQPTGGTVPANAQPVAVGNSGYAVVITLAPITVGQPASGSVFFSTDNTFTGLAGAPPNAPVLTLGTPLLYTDFRVSSATGPSVTFTAQLGFNFTVPAGLTGPYSLAEYDPSQTTYTKIAGPLAATDPTHVRLFGPATPTTLTLNQNYTYVLYH